MNRMFPVINLGQRPRVFGPLNPETIDRLCDASEAYNNAESTPAGSRAMRDAVADLRSIIGPMSLTDKRAAAAQLRILCPNANPILSQVLPPETPEFPYFTPPPPPPPVMTIEPLRPPTTMTPTGTRGPGYGAFNRFDVVTGVPGPGYEPPFEPAPVTTGSEEPFTVSPREEVPPPMGPPPVASVGEGCWYTFGKGYSWGPRPSGGESTGLNKIDCQNLITRDREIRGLPVATEVPAAAQVSQPQVTQEASQVAPSMPGAAFQAPPADVPSIDCSHLGPGAWYDGRQCRGAMASAGGYGGLLNVASMAPAASAVSFGMSARIPTQPLMTGRF